MGSRFVYFSSLEWSYHSLTHLYPGLVSTQNTSEKSSRRTRTQFSTSPGRKMIVRSYVRRPFSTPTELLIVHVSPLRRLRRVVIKLRECRTSRRVRWWPFSTAIGVASRCRRGIRNRPVRLSRFRLPPDLFGTTVLTCFACRRRPLDGFARRQHPRLRPPGRLDGEQCGLGLASPVGQRWG